MLKKNDRVRLLRNITRREGPYATKGETGTVHELFTAGTGAGERIRYAKVLMNQGGIKTFRISSLEKTS